MKIIQFIHHGSQFHFPNNLHGHETLIRPFGIRCWNQEKDGHKRKFISYNGHYLETLNSNPKNANLYFGGEWEAQSFYKKTPYFGNPNHAKNSEPNAIHKPIFVRNSIPPQGAICHSTDPYIFNKCHLYTHCKQKNRTMRTLSNGSILLFGSKINGNFVLDEVFVVGGMLKYENNIEDFISSNPNCKSIKKTEVFEFTNYRYITPSFHTIYIGKSYYESSEFFSFFPCKIDGSLFERPIIPDHIFSTNGVQMMGLGYIFKNNTFEQNKEYWQRLVNYLIEEGYCLGLYAEEPDYYTTLADARADFKTF